MSDNQQVGLRQPWLGILGTVIVLILAFSVALWFKPDTFGSWVTFLAIASIPTMMVVSMVWQNNYPMPAAKLEQPLKGLYLFLISIGGGFLVASLSLAIAGGFVTPPGPQLIIFIVNSVPIAIWLIVVWQCWPMTAINQHPAFVGLGTLILTYIVNWVVLRIFFNFSFMQGSPSYVAKLDPGGLFMAANANVFLVSVVAVILFLILFDFWPLSSIAKKSPAFGKQPVFGIMASILVLILSYVLWFIFVNILQMDVTKYLVNVVCCYIFGQFIMLLMMQTYPFQITKQPVKGLAVNIMAVLLAFVMNYVYTKANILITGGLPSGAPNYALEMWISSALLAVTFPIMTVYSSFFSYWPLLEPVPKAEDTELNAYT